MRANRRIPTLQRRLDHLNKVIKAKEGTKQSLMYCCAEAAALEWAISELKSTMSKKVIV